TLVRSVVGLAPERSRYVPMVLRLGQDFVIVANVLHRSGAGGIGLWNEEHRFYFDVIRHDQERFPLRIFSMVGLVPLFAATIMTAAEFDRLPSVTRTVDGILP